MFINFFLNINNFFYKKKYSYKNKFNFINTLKQYLNYAFEEKTYFNYLVKIKNSFYKNNDFFFFKKTKLLLKSGYCRSRPYCKNIVLLGLYINILFIYETNILYYGNSINF